MADCMAACIEIGGELSENLVEELVAAIDGSGAGFEWGERTDPDEIRTQLAATVEAGTTLGLTDDQARWGRFERLEEWLVEHAVPWRRHTSAKYEYDAEVVWFEPGMEHPRELSANEDADVVVPLPTLRALLDNASDQPVEIALRELVAELTVPDLAPLRIVPATVSTG